VYQYFNWTCVCQYEFKRGNAPLVILNLKPVGHKKRAVKTEKEKPAYHALKNQLKPNTYMKTQN